MTMCGRISALGAVAVLALWGWTGMARADEPGSAARDGGAKTFTLGFDGQADTDLVRGYRGGHVAHYGGGHYGGYGRAYYGGYGRGYYGGYGRSFYGYGRGFYGNYYRPYYGGFYAGYRSYYRPYYYAGYYPQYYSSGYYSPYSSYYYAPSVYYSTPYYCPISYGVESLAPAVINGSGAYYQGQPGYQGQPSYQGQPGANPVMPPAPAGNGSYPAQPDNGGTYPYNGGPGNQVPQQQQLPPDAAPIKGVPLKTVPLEGKLVSLPPKQATKTATAAPATRFAYPAYGEQSRETSFATARPEATPTPTTQTAQKSPR